MAAPEGLQLGSTLFSFTNEYHSREYSLDQLLEQVAKRGLGPGVELVGFSHVRDFPKVDDAFADHFQNLMAKLGLEQSCLGINADVYIRRDKPMTEDESFAYHEAQVRTAARLGFPVARYQFAAGTGVIKRLLPLAEKLNVKLGLEIHAPDSVTSPIVMKYRDLYDELDSPCLGFVPDFGSTATCVSPAFTNYFRSLQIPENLIALGEKTWLEPTDPTNPHGKIAIFHERAKAIGARETDIAEMFMIFGLFSHQDPQMWREIMPQVVHIHGKFYDFNEHGSESAIPYEEILPVFVEGGYNGFMSSEWEGHFFSDEPGFPKVQAHQALCKRILGRV